MMRTGQNQRLEMRRGANFKRIILFFAFNLAFFSSLKRQQDPTLKLKPREEMAKEALKTYIPGINEALKLCANRSRRRRS